MATTIRFSDLLATGTLLKSAQQNPDNQQFEQDFSRLAYSFIQDRANNLMKYLLGFEVVSRSSDGTKAVGIFGFKVGKDYYYIPAFFINSQIRGIDMILDKKNNNFIPLTEDWIDSICNRQTIELGGDTNDQTPSAEDFENPNFDFIQQPKVGPLGSASKAAEANDTVSFVGVWEEMKKTAESLAKNDRSFNDAWSGFVSSYIGKPYPFKKEASASKIKDYCKKIGGPEAVSALMNSIGGNIKTASAALTFYTGVDSFYTDTFDRDCYSIKKAQEANPRPDVTVTDTPADKDQAKDVIEHGFTIIDRRPNTVKTEVFEDKLDASFGSPDRPGIYDVLMPDGSFKEGYVFTCNRINGPAMKSWSTEKINTFVYFPDTNKYTAEKSESVIVKGNPKGRFQEIIDKANNLDSIKIDDSVIFVSPNGSCLGPFDVHTISKEDGRTHLDGWWKHGLSYVGEQIWSPEGVDFAGFTGNPKVCAGAVQMPSDWKLFKLKKYSYDGPRDESPFERIGTNASLTEALMKRACHRLEVFADGNDFSVRMDHATPVGQQSYKQASVLLVTKLGLGTESTKRLLKSASTNGKTKCIIKFAQQSPFVGVSMGAPNEPSPSSDPYTGIPSYTTPYETIEQGSFTNVPSDGDPNQPGENIGGEMERNSEKSIDEDAQELVRQAAQLGQKEVFDHAAIGGLSKVYDTGAVIDSYIPEFVKTLDRLGRILFLYYWMHDDFTQRYGSDNSIEMEDLLKGTFKSLGDLTLELKKRAIGTGEDEQTLD